MRLVAANPASYVAAATAAAVSCVLLAASPAADFGVRPLKVWSLRQEMKAHFRRSLQWTVGTMIALATLIVVAAAVVVALR